MEEGYKLIQNFDYVNPEDEERDMPNVRYIKIDLNKLILERTDPYGFWTIHWEKGQVPNELKGHYTSAAEAKKAAEAYLGGKKKKIREDTV